MKIMDSADKKLYFTLRNKAEEMRKNPTPAEKFFWNVVSKNKTGFKFRRQHILGKFIVDFFCFEKNLIVEIDGEIHDKQREQDFEREEILKNMGYTVIRFTNKEVFEGIMDRLEVILRK